MDTKATSEEDKFLRELGRLIYRFPKATLALFFGIISVIFGLGWSTSRILKPPMNMRERAAIEDVYRRHRIPIPNSTDLVQLIQHLSAQLEPRSKGFPNQTKKSEKAISSAELPPEPRLETRGKSLREIFFAKYEYSYKAIDSHMMELIKQRIREGEELDKTANEIDFSSFHFAWIERFYVDIIDGLDPLGDEDLWNNETLKARWYQNQWFNGNDPKDNREYAIVFKRYLAIAKSLLSGRVKVIDKKIQRERGISP